MANASSTPDSVNEVTAVGGTVTAVTACLVCLTVYLIRRQKRAAIPSGEQVSTKAVTLSGEAPDSGQTSSDSQPHGHSPELTSSACFQDGEQKLSPIAPGRLTIRNEKQESRWGRFRYGGLRPTVEMVSDHQADATHPGQRMSEMHARDTSPKELCALSQHDDGLPTEVEHPYQGRASTEPYEQVSILASPEKLPFDRDTQELPQHAPSPDGLTPAVPTIPSTTERPARNSTCPSASRSEDFNGCHDIPSTSMSESANLAQRLRALSDRLDSYNGGSAGVERVRSKSVSSANSPTCKYHEHDLYSYDKLAPKSTSHSSNMSNTSPRTPELDATAVHNRTVSQAACHKLMNDAGRVCAVNDTACEVLNSTSCLPPPLPCADAEKTAVSDSFRQYISQECSDYLDPADCHPNLPKAAESVTLSRAGNPGSDHKATCLQHVRHSDDQNGRANVYEVIGPVLADDHALRNNVMPTKSNRRSTVTVVCPGQHTCMSEISHSASQRQRDKRASMEPYSIVQLKIPLDQQMSHSSAGTTENTD